ncbi:hypothetical protein [Streptomyces sp. AHA2]|uniref:hypothetical protein n=1 Tax=Streptomyces sp. AHA2 TaxID=3064526 RepID=UPI002FDF7BEB
MIGKAANGAPARPTQESRNFYEEVNELHKLAVLLTHGYSTELYNYEEVQSGGF